MSSNDRFYQMKFRHRDVKHGDVGSMLMIQGLVVGGCGANAILLLPSADDNALPFPVIHLTAEQWSEWLQRSDNPEILVGLPKIFQRKVRYEISGAIQQKIWVADKLQCMYCGREMGDVQLTVDHFVPLELGGSNDVSNYLSACRKCNKDKGSEDPQSFCEARGLKYQDYVIYLANRKIK